MKATMIVNGLDVSDGPVLVYKASMPLLVELAVEGWLARHPWTVEDARARRDGPGIACGCMGAPVPVAGFPCWCELNEIAVQIALGEEPTGWPNGGLLEGYAPTWRERLAEIYAPPPEPSWPRGKPRPLP